MIIPIRDTIPSRNYPVVTMAIIGINVLFFFMQPSSGNQAGHFFYVYGLVPARYTDPHLSEYFTWVQQFFSFFSFMFLHGGFLHLLGNMWSLWIFGDNVEDRLGPLRYLAFYLACGVASGISHLVLNIGSNVPTIGASGAIAGVMGAYFILYPRARILTLVLILLIEIPAYFFLGFWFLMQFFSATASSGTGGGIAWWAHMGGFVFGIVLLKLFDRLPHTGASKVISSATVRKRTDRLQVIRPIHMDNDDPNLYGIIDVAPLEALRGTVKIVNIPWGFQKRLVKVVVPAGIKADQQLRLRGQGRLMPDDRRGDLLLKVKVRTNLEGSADRIESSESDGMTS